MKAAIFLVLASGAAASSVQEVVDGLFDKYLPQRASWEDVKACRGSCGADKICLARCPHFECPFQRISKQCDILQTSVAAAKACHTACDHHDWACHFRCPMAMPTSVKELQGLAEAMACHTRCGADRACHRSTCANPWAERHGLCEKLEAVVACHRSGSDHTTCPHLDNTTKARLLQEPSSLAKDIMNHVMNHVLPLPKGQAATMQEVRACHMRCGRDADCHRQCPAGAFGRVKHQCSALKEASACHKACEHAETRCPVKKAECHFRCPASMPASVKELKGLTDHVLCHMSCSNDGACHKECPDSVWTRKQAQCEQYDKVVACHRGCGHSHGCHTSCPHFAEDMLQEVQQEPHSLAKDIIDVLVV